MPHKKHKPLPKNNTKTQSPASTNIPKIKEAINTNDDDYLHNMINLSIPTKEVGKSVSFYLSQDAIKILKKYLKVNHIKNQSKLMDTVIKTVLKIDE